ncbi:hypothetical protein SH449x_000232 [Pirellulaceae bacterium SH449]
MEFRSQALGFQTIGFAHLLLLLSIPQGGIGFGQDTKNVEQNRDDQETIVDSAVDPEKDAKDKIDAHTPEGQLAIKRFYLKQVFQVEIELIQQLCNPTPEQVMKLRIASKGAVKKLTEEWGKDKDLLPRVIAESQEGDEVEQLSNMADLEIKEIEDINEIDLSWIEDVVLDINGNPFKTNRPREHKFWQSLVTTILSSDQNNIMSACSESQELKRREELLTLFMGAVTRELHLNEEQQKKLQGVLHPHFAKTDLTSLTVFEPYLSYCIASKATKEELSKVLSPAQMQLYFIFLAPVKDFVELAQAEDEEVQGEREDADDGV